MQGKEEQEVMWENFQNHLKNEYLIERFYDEKAKEFHNLKLGQLSMDKFVTKFTSPLRFVSYIREKKSKVQ